MIDSPISDSPTGSEYEPDTMPPRKPKPAPKRIAKDDIQIPQIEVPMSQFFESSDNGKPVKDIFEHVNRSAELRRGGGRRTDDKIKRPMNAFMLYRKAYAEAVAKFMNKNNHQAISKILGVSWKLEPKEIKEIYQQYAEIDKANHLIAFPDYVFQPKKVKKQVVKRREKPTESKQTEPDDSPTFGYRTILEESPQAVGHSTPGEGYLDQLAPERMDWSNPDLGMNRSAFEMPNPGRPPPAHYGQYNPYNGQYFGQITYPTLYGSSYQEHNVYRPVHESGHSKSMGPYDITSLSHAYQTEQFYAMPTTPDNRHLDPGLFSGSNDTTSHGAGLITQQGFDDFGNESILHGQTPGMGPMYSPIRFDQLSSAFDFRQDLTKGANEEETEQSGN